MSGETAEVAYDGGVLDGAANRTREIVAMLRLWESLGQRDAGVYADAIERHYKIVNARVVL